MRSASVEWTKSTTTKGFQVPSQIVPKEMKVAGESALGIGKEGKHRLSRSGQFRHREDIGEWNLLHGGEKPELPPSLRPAIQ